MLSLSCKKDDWHRFVWKIENFSYCWHKKNEYISSPIFCMDGIRSSLQIFPRGKDSGNYIACYLKREVSVGRQVKFKVACMNPDNSSLSTWISCDGKRFTNYETDGSDRFLERNDVFVNERKKYLPNDTLTVCCCIARNNIFSNLYNVLARTRIEVCRQTIIGQIEEFSYRESETIQVHSSSLENPILQVNVLLGEGACCDENLLIEIFSENNEKRKFSTCKVFLLDTTGNKLRCGKSDIWFDKDKTAQKWIFPLIFTKRDLMEKKNLYLPDDILSLQFDCSSSLGILSEKKENIDVVDFSEGGYVGPSDRVEESGILKDLGKLFRENILCDINLQTRTKTFPAHKAILSSRSSVFEAMFTNDWKEKAANKIDIKHFDDETVRRLLMYIYTNTIDDLQWESAAQLYEAADKYSIRSLKKECAYLLEDTLNLENICKCLELADKHKDDYLKDSVERFILQRDKDIIGSDKWKNLELENPQLISETMYNLYKRAKKF